MPPSKLAELARVLVYCTWLPLLINRPINKYTFKDLSATFKASTKVSFDKGLLNFVTDIHFSVIIHIHSKFVHKNYSFDKKTLIVGDFD